MNNPITSSGFADELEIFRVEVQGATQFFYTFWTINSIISKDKKALDIVNETTLFWRTTLASLETSFFINLGRIFDQKSEHNIDTLIGLAQKEIQVFSKEALADRKRALSANADDWLEEYLKGVYVPSQDDFRCIRRNISKFRKIYETNYRDIRHKVHAHKELSGEDVRKLYKQTNITELAKIFTFLNQLYRILDELYLNGRKPRLWRIPYSVKLMMRKPLPKGTFGSVQQQTVQEAQEFFKLLLENKESK